LPRSKSRKSQRSPAPAPTISSPPSREPLLRRIPWLPVAITLIVLITAAFTVPSVRDAVTLGDVNEAHLETPAAYLALGPLSSILDTLTLLTVGQHIAVGLWIIGTFVLVRVLLARRGTSIRREAIAAVVFLVLLVGTYAFGALVPRPMARLAVTDLVGVLAVDFHAHTKYSHDGRPGWTEDDVRDWYRSAGYDVVYITDHRSFEGAERGVAANPPQAGQGTMIFQGLEAFYRGEHVNILSAGRRYKGLTTDDLKDVDGQSLMLANLVQVSAPVIIETIPGNLSRVPTPADSGGGVTAIEIVDGSPRGLSQTRRDRARIIKLADSLNLAYVTGTDNHGWGRTAPGWTLLRIPGWRGMGGDSLSRRIEDILRRGRRESTRTVERRVADGTTPLSLALAGPLVAWRMLTTLGPDERVMWLVWTWALVAIARGLRRYRIQPSATA